MRIMVLGMALLLSTAVSAEQVGELNLPETLAKFELRQVFNNEQSHPGLGYTVLYNAPGVKVSLYVYNLQGHVSDGMSSPTRDHFKQAQREVLLVHPDAKLIGKAQQIRAGGMPLLHAAFVYLEDNYGVKEKVISHLYLTGLRDNYIKIRATYSFEEADAGKAALAPFVESIITSIK